MKNVNKKFYTRTDGRTDSVRIEMISQPLLTSKVRRAKNTQLEVVDVQLLSEQGCLYGLLRHVAPLVSDVRINFVTAGF